jgi:hypothetical protein
MKKYILLASFALLGLTISCTGDKKNDTEETTPAESTVETADSHDASVAVEQQPMVGESQPVNAMPAENNTSGARLNPAHGEPGHDCAVPVGSPLPAPGSTPATTTAPQQITATPGTPAPTSIMNAPPAGAPATSGATAPGMNPPHGEPGHDCAIPVGSPLKK